MSIKERRRQRLLGKRLRSNTPRTTAKNSASGLNVYEPSERVGVSTL